VNKTMLVAVAVAAVVVGGCGAKEKAAPPPPEVYVAEVVQRDVPVESELVGQTRGAQDVEIRARVEGYLDRVAFSEGTFVTRGTLLYQIDPKDLQAALARAQGDLASAQARFAKSENDVARYTPLVAQQAVSRQELDNAVAARDAAKAQVDAGQAIVDKARNDLSYTTITSPIDGIVGTTLVKAGSLVGRGESTLLTTVSRIASKGFVRWIPTFFASGSHQAPMPHTIRPGARSSSVRNVAASRPILRVQLLITPEPTLMRSVTAA